MHSFVTSDKMKSYNSFSRGFDSHCFLHHVDEVQPLGTERSQDLCHHHHLLGKILCYHRIILIRKDLEDHQIQWLTQH